jgi:hypothetical protein
VARVAGKDLAALDDNLFALLDILIAHCVPVLPWQPCLHRTPGKPWSQLDRLGRTIQQLEQRPFGRLPSRAIAMATPYRHAEKVDPSNEAQKQLACGCQRHLRGGHKPQYERLITNQRPVKVAAINICQENKSPIPRILHTPTEYLHLVAMATHTCCVLHSALRISAAWYISARSSIIVVAVQKKFGIQPILDVRRFSMSNFVCTSKQISSRRNNQIISCWLPKQPRMQSQFNSKMNHSHLHFLG